MVHPYSNGARRTSVAPGPHRSATATAGASAEAVPAHHPWAPMHITKCYPVFPIGHIHAQFHKALCALFMDQC